MKVKKQGRANGCGTLERRGAIWRARWVVDGKTYTRSTGTSDKREAEKMLAEFVRPFQAGTEAERLEGIAVRLQGVRGEIAAYEDAKPATSLRRAFADYRANLSRPNRAQDGTMDRYESQYGELVAWIEENHPGVTEMRGITQEMANEYALHVRQTRGANTFNKRITLFRSMWSHLSASARLPCNPWTAIRKMETEGVRKRELTAEELRRVCESVEGEMRVLFALGIYTGLRLGDCARLDWSAVDMVRRSVSSTTHKTGQEVRIPLHPALAAILAETPKGKRRGKVVPGIAAEYAHDAAALSVRIRRLFESCGIVTGGDAYANGRKSVVVGFHSLRHTFVSMSVNSGAPLALVQSLVGHASAAMTEHYFHANESALRSAVELLPDVTGGTPTPASAAVVDVESVSASARVSQFRAMWADMTDAERAEVRAIVEKAED